MDNERERLKIAANIGPRWSAQVFFINNTGDAIRSCRLPGSNPSWGISSPHALISSLLTHRAHAAVHGLTPAGAADIKTSVKYIQLVGRGRCRHAQQRAVWVYSP